MTDYKDCFARLSPIVCNALNAKICNNCRFYKHKNDVPNYKKYIDYSLINSKNIIMNNNTSLMPTISNENIKNDNFILYKD